jgi:hypothetical protein
MTERLRDGMRSVLNSGRLPWSKSFIVAPGSESRSTLSILEPDGRTDIPLPDYPYHASLMMAR